MAFLLGLEKVHLDYPTKSVFDDVTLGVNEGDRIGIVGRNGDGKSSLLKLLAQTITPNSGTATRRNNITVGVLGQTDDLSDDDTVEHAVVGDADEYEWASNAQSRAIIDGLVADLPWNGRIGDLSGGQRRRVDLARLLIRDWDVLMLDEPTNHLDIRTISWLAAHLAHRWGKFSGALLVITHDRWFLDEVCTSMWEVHDRQVEAFEGGYSAYLLQRVERDRQIQKAEQKRRNLARKELAWLSRGARARSTKPRFHVERARELIDAEPSVRNALELKRLSVARLGKQVLELSNVYEVLGKTRILDDINWNIGPGDRIGIVGENGAGKTTLLRILEGDLTPTAGHVKVGKTVKFGMLSQRLDELEEIKTDRVREVLSRLHTTYQIDGKDITPAMLLERLGFERQQLNTPVQDLSGGQKRRLQLMLVLLSEPNVLILDEPGNDMDTDMLAVMEDLLDSWPGTLIMVTHDRFLMERVTDDQYALIDGHIRHLPGGIDEYLRLVSRQSKVDSGNADRSRSSGGASPQNAIASQSDAAPLTPAMTGAEMYKARKELASLERRIATHEQKIEDARNAMGEVDPSDYVELTKRQQAVDALVDEKSQLEEEWLELAERLGEDA